jgi:uncharacterized damage-inducible protein DinB
MGRFFVQTFLRCCILLCFPTGVKEQVEWSRASIAHPFCEVSSVSEFTKDLFLQALDHWGRFANAFGRLPAAEQTDFLKGQGYDSMRDMLVHVAVWWEEARGIIRDRIEQRERPARKYDFDEFNAASLKRFQETPETEFMRWYESERQEMIALVSGLSEEQLRARRIYGWLDGVILTHLKEHGVDAPRFLIIDALEREWADYPKDFRNLASEKQTAFVAKQGFARFQDLAAHIMAWWEQGIGVIEGSSTEDPSDEADIDAFNAEAVQRWGKMEEAEVLAQYERTRLALRDLVDTLPEEVYSRPNAQMWLRADILAHYYEHAI